MRWLAFLLLLFALPSVAAQIPAPTLDVVLEVPGEPLRVGTPATVHVAVERVCANMLQRFDESPVMVSVSAPAGFAVQAPAEVTLPEALCVQGGGSVEFDIVLTAAEAATRGEPLSVSMTVSQSSSDPLQPAPSPRTDNFQVTVAPDPEPAVEPAVEEKESPAPAAVLLALGLVALAALRRRL